MKPICLVLGAALMSGSLASPLCAKNRRGVFAAEKQKPTTVKVLLHDQARSLLVEVKGGYKAVCPVTGSVVASGFSTKRAIMRPGLKGLFWGELLPTTYHVRIVPENNDTAIFVNGYQYKGALEIHDIGGAICAVNDVDMESYLKSCLATDFLDIEDTEVLSALAITARTNAYYFIHEHKGAMWHVSAQDSGYRGYAVTLQHPSLEEAIIKTEDAVLTYEGQPFQTSWTQNSAGKTAPFGAIHHTEGPSPKGTNLKGMVSERLKSAWSFQMAKKELEHLAHLANISTVSTHSEENSGKVRAIQVKSNDSEERVLNFETLQNVVGKAKLKSNDFTLEINQDMVKFKGYGEGDGVGLCLHSAQILSKKGFNARQILGELFSDTSLQKTKPE